MITITINGASVSGKKDDTILDAATSIGVEIPTLCYLKGLAPYGGCRLCLVEIIQGNRSQLVASCGYYLKEGLTVETNSPRVKRARGLVLELLLAAMPGSLEIQRYARENSVTSTRYKRNLDHCVLCGLCVRYCEEIKKENCLGFVGRGVDREVAWVPLSKYKDACENCMECQKLCPTGVFPSNWGIAQNTLIR